MTGIDDDTPTFNLKAVIQETGLRPDTLRAWERRYGLPQPDRTEGGHRLYSRHDIETLKWLVARQQEGLSISRAVDLWHRLASEGQDPLHTAELPSPVAGLVTTPFSVGHGIAELRQAWIDASLAYDEQMAEHIIAQASALYPIETVCFELLQKGLAAIGSGWYQGDISVQQEHFASALAVRWIEALVVATPAPTRSDRVLVGCPPDEEHTFSLLVITLLLRRHGWKALYLGANVPVSRLEYTIAAARPQLVILAAQRLPSAATLLDMARLLRQEEVPLAYGGAIFNQVPAIRPRIPGHFLGERLDLVPQVVEQLLESPRPVPKAEPVPESCAEALAHYREQQALIEADVWAALKSSQIDPAHLANANTQMAGNVVAALSLGSMAYLGSTITWLEGLLGNYQVPTGQLYDYLDAYYQAARARLDKRGAPVINWLAGLAGKKVTSRL